MSTDTAPHCTIDLSAGERPEGLYVATGFDGAPDDDGILMRFSVIPPPYDQAVYYAAFQKHDLMHPRPGWWPAGANRTQALAVTDFREVETGGLFVVCALSDGRFLALLPMAGAVAASWFAAGDPGPMLNLGTLGTEPAAGDLPVLAWAFAGNAHAACRCVWELAVAHPTVGGSTRMRWQKRYPEAFRYLGWCSWEGFKRDISESVLLEAIDGIEDSGLPVKYVLVDDGHLAHRNKQLVCSGPNEKFPNGWHALLERRHPERIRWMGLWLNFNGYWLGIAPQNELGELNDHLMPVCAAGWGVKEPGISALLPAEGYLHSTAFYDVMIGTARRAGFDFVKVDDQAANLKHYRRTGQPVACAVNNAQALETACARHMDGLINCMAHSIVCVFNTRISAVTRCSEDYALGEQRQARRHLYNSYANMLWLGQTAWGDHDMFHSNDPVSGEEMAFSKALSGGPVYLSDNPQSFVPDVIRPLCFEDGELLRPLAPAAPLPDSVFVDPFSDGRAYRVVAPLASASAAVAVYNLTEPERPVEASIRAQDYADAGCMMQPETRPWPLPAEGLVLYDWYAGKACLLRGDYRLRLSGFGHRQAILCPVHGGWAVVGRPDKFLSPAAVEVVSCDGSELILQMLESGPLLLWRRDGLPVMDGAELRELGDGLWRADLPVGERNRVVRCRLE